MTETCRDLLVSARFEPFLTGWLEFAGRDVPGVPSCAEWPARFEITRLGPVMTKYGGEPDVIRYRVCSDVWPNAGSWTRCSWIDGVREVWLPLLHDDLGRRVS